MPFFNGGDTKSIDLRASMTPAASMEGASHESGGRNLPFAIVSSSGQDEDYPAGELNKGIQGRGWQSSRFCFYPQELVLELQWPSRIINMQLLCHEYKIPSKVEVFVSLTTPWIHSEKAVTQMKRLGYLSLDPNDRSGHQARELKSIHVDSPAAVVRLVLHNCHTNKLNIYNQVGLVALIVTGDPLDDNQITQIKKQGFSPLLHTPRIQMPTNKVADTKFNAVDSFTATRIQRLQQEKVLAVQEEDYDEAKRLKILIDKLKGLGEQIKQLELQKRAAVEVEDYDAAKICKLEIEMLRKCDGVLAESLSCPNETLECASNTEELWRSEESTICSLEGRHSKRDPHHEGNLKKSVLLSVGKESWTQTRDQSLGVSIQKDASSFPNTTISHKPEKYPPRANQVGQMRSGLLSTVFPWWKGKIPLQNLGEGLKPGLQMMGNLDKDLKPPLKQMKNSDQDSKPALNHMKESEEASNLALKEMRKFSEDQTNLNHIRRSDKDSNPALKQMRSSYEDLQPELRWMKFFDDNVKPFVKQLANIGIHEQEQKKVVVSAQEHSVAYQSTDTEHVASASHSAPSLPTAVISFTQPLDGPCQSTTDEHHASVSHTAPVLAQQNVRNTFAMSEQSGPQMQLSSSGDEPNAPEPLSEVVKIESGPLLNMLDLYHVQCLYSKQWQLRDKGFQFIAKLLQSKGLGGDSFSTFRILDVVLIRALNDRVPNVFYCGLQLLRAYVSKYSGEIPARDLQHSSAEFVNILLDKLGDSNVRSKDAAAETLMFMASKKELGLDVVAKPLLRPTKNQAIWKPVLGRLNWLLVAVPTFGVQPQSRQGFSSETLMSYVSQAINSPNGEVRNASVKVITEVYKLLGATVEKYLKGIKPMIREVLVNNFERVTLETRNSEDPLTYEERRNIPIPRRPQKPPLSDIEKALDNDILKAMSLEAQKAMVFESEPATFMKNGKEVKDGGLHTMLVEQQDQLSNPEDLGTKYSTEATAPVENFSLDCLDDDTQVGKDESSDQCLFCGKQDPNFLKEDNLDLHFCQICPMLVGCCNCKHIVEISSLKEHYLTECTSGIRYVECSKCSEAIPEARMTAHLKSKECRHGKHHKPYRCPLCHHTVQPGDAGWREHLLKPRGCPKNPRTHSFN